MRVGGASHAYSAHQAGMSSLWHDVDYIPEERFHLPVVRSGLEDMALPSELHQLPEGVADPFEKMEAVFEIAAQQMERGIKGSDFLHGKPPPAGSAASGGVGGSGGAPAMPAPAPMGTSDVDPGAAVRHRPENLDDITRPQQIGQKRVSSSEGLAHESARMDIEQARMQGQASVVSGVKASNATKTAAENENEHVAPAQAGSNNAVGDVLATAATFLPMAAGQALASVTQGPLPALAVEAAKVTTVVGGAAAGANVVATGVAEGLKDEEPVVVRRGLNRRDRNRDDDKW